jgi:hypothetical protein
MEIKPLEPIGRPNRKLRDYVDQIAQLRSDGYSIAAIHRAFVAAGVFASYWSVRREFCRSASLDGKGAAQHDPAQLAAALNRDEMRTANIEQFFSTAVTNPLLMRKKGNTS